MPVVDAIATHDPDRGQCVLFIVNRSVDEAVELTADVRGVQARSLTEALTVTDADMGATNTEMNPNRVIPKMLDGANLDASTLCAVLPPVSWSVVRLATV